LAIHEELESSPHLRVNPLPTTHTGGGEQLHSIYYIDDLSRGIRAEYIEIVVGRKFDSTPAL